MACLSPSSSPWRTCWLSAFTGGLFTVSTATRPRRSRSTDWVMAVMGSPPEETASDYTPSDPGCQTWHAPFRDSREWIPAASMPRPPCSPRAEQSSTTSRPMCGSVPPCTTAIYVRSTWAARSRSSRCRFARFSDLAKQTFASELVYDVTHPHGRQERLLHHYRFRYLVRFEAEHLLARSGFSVEHVYSGFDEAPYGHRYPGELI